jgi:murein DD-endopeptidase MepM/ murein hydrolase activator NlpD
MADTASWSNYDGPFKRKKQEENKSEKPYVNLHPYFLDLKLLTKADSLKKIPAHAQYLSWDNQNIWHKRRTVHFPNDSIVFKLINEDCDFVFPTEMGRQTSPFGPRWGRMHYGLDLDLDTGDPVVSAFEGLVRISQWSDSYGNVVVVRHPNGLETLYAHLNERKVLSGQYVQAGELLGLGGNTGRSFGAHLHWEIRYLGNPFDPNYVVIPSKKALKSTNFILTQKKLDQPLIVRIAPKAPEENKPKTETKKILRIVIKIILPKNIIP